MEPNNTQTSTPNQEVMKLINSLLPSDVGVAHTNPQDREAWGWVRVDASLIETLEQWNEVEGGDFNGLGVIHLVREAIERHCNLLRRREVQKQKAIVETIRQDVAQQEAATARKAESDYNAKFLADLGISMDGEL
jgi:hypothetical protein